MNAQELTAALGGRWSGSSGSAKCPSHDDSDPSLSISEGQDGKLLVKCHGGCAQDRVIGALKARDLWPGAPRPAPVPARRPTKAKPAPAPPSNQAHAIEIWRATRPAEHTPAEDNLRGRGITISVPPTIRYHPALLHPDTGIHLPALVAAVCNVERKITGITRIYLTLTGNKAPLTRPKMALGTLRGGAVRLAPTTDRVWLTEGVEDGLAVMQMMQEPAWAVLGTSVFKSVELPESIKQVILAPDGDDAGQAVVQETARRLAGQGREVRVAKLPAGKDWVDVLDENEERDGILEFDLEQYRPDAESAARREAING